MPNWFLGFPVPRAKFAEVAAQAASSVALPFDDLYYHTFFDSIDGFSSVTNAGGSITLTEDGVVLAITSSAGSIAELGKYATSSVVTLTFSKTRTCIFSFRLQTLVNNTAEFWISTGDIFGGRGFGLYHSAGKLYARTKASSGTTDSEIENIGSGPYIITRLFKAVFTPAVDCKFYLDGTLVATITTNLPSDSSGADLFLHFYAQRAAGGQGGNIIIRQFDCHQEA